MTEERHQRPPHPPTRFINGLLEHPTRPGELQAGRDLGKALHTIHVGGNVAAAQVVASLHVQSRITKAAGKSRNFNRPRVPAAKPVSVPLKK